MYRQADIMHNADQRPVIYDKQDKKWIGDKEMGRDGFHISLLSYFLYCPAFYWPFELDCGEHNKTNCLHPSFILVFVHSLFGRRGKQ